MATVDVRGQACPMPLIATKKALKEVGADEEIVILIDNKTSCDNVERFLHDNGMVVRIAEEDAVYTLTMRKSDKELTHPDAASYCPTCAATPHVIAFSGNRMGSGSEELGEILMKAFVNTIKEVEPLPSHLIFYNAGIFLTVEGSSLLQPLHELQEMGVTVLVCGTCAEYYKKKEQVRVGTISNMYTILEALSAAGNIIQP